MDLPKLRITLNDMARIPSVASLTKRLNDLKKREAALKTRQQQEPKIGTGQPRPTESVKYKSIFTAEDFILNAPSKGIQFFGGLSALGLSAPDASPRISRGFKPARIKAVKGKAKPETATSDLSGRKYFKYSITATGDTQATFSAPISADTVASLKSKVTAIITAKKDDIGEYGRISFEPERPIFSASGQSAGGG